MKSKLFNGLILILLVGSLMTNTYLFTEVKSIKAQLNTQSPTINRVDYDITSDAQNVVKQVSSSVVTIEVYYNGVQAGSGSGVVYDKENGKFFVVTNHHVVDGGESISCLFNSGESVNATLLGSDPYTDLAVLAIEPDFEITPIQIGDSDLLDIGEEVLAIGSPLGSNYSGSTTKGIISGTNRVVSVDLDSDGTDDWDMTVLQTDAAINPGNSGGALVNMAGELVGITSMKISDTDGMGFAIPITQAMSDLDELRMKGKIERPVLGVQVVAMSDISLRQRYYYNIRSESLDGVYVYSVQDNSVASKAGIKQGDIIIGIDDDEITTYKSFVSALYSKHIGDQIKIVVERNNKIEEIHATLK